MVRTAADFLKELLDSQRVFGRLGYFFSGSSRMPVLSPMVWYRPFWNSVSHQCRKRLDAGPVIAWFAGHIPNPILRLRFLRAMMLPGLEQYPRPKSYKFWFLV